MDNQDFNFEVIEEGTKLSEPNSKGWAKEINFVSWNSREPKWDIHAWNSDKSNCRKASTFTEEELLNLADFINRRFSK